jgi:hypothetical protein
MFMLFHIVYFFIEGGFDTRTQFSIWHTIAATQPTQYVYYKAARTFVFLTENL